MVSFFETIQSNPVSAIIIIILFLVALKQFYEFVTWVLGLMNIYHKKQSHEEKIEDMVNKIEKSVEKIDDHAKEQDKRLDEMKEIIDKTTKNIEKLSKTDAEHKQSIKDLSDSVSVIQTSLDDLKAENKEQVIASYSSTLYRLYMEATKVGYTDRAALETFSKLSEIYLRNGGNSVFKKKIIPQFMDLPIKEFDDSNNSNN